MITISVTNFRNNMFTYLEKIEAGETIILERNKKEVARLVPSKQTNWRERMSSKPEILVSAEKLIEPIEDIWEDYL
ncbi:MAG: type II toxin-antitoxin system Phd/YefM family antitoxin [Calditrichaeota bacterium]|nr:MAG: type II toxin-antitoxin system Phd/YefM family antitoxin [Calditrichota bacterium]MBL1207914.1 type II toxin-antitoxin system Phd/YefM family antitoxin [Calditrichota bacterium]NOG47749.1 type II toxin-antitoxin system Phd/YefM family antitoxin [Calditrichota bacterium]